MNDRFAVCIIVTNQSGVLTRISSLFSQRGFNIDTFTSGETENPAYAIHIWSRLINDIMNNEPDDVNKKRGLSKDWWERTGPYSSSGFVEINLYEYLDDLKKYLFAPSFSFEEADEALNLIISFLQFAASCHFHVIARLK